MSFKPFDVGQQVIIIRSNGKPQIAKVTKIKDDEIGMMVEWNEDDVFKGKEVTLDQLLLWNSEDNTPKKRKAVPDNRNINSRKTIFTRDIKSKHPPVLSADKHRHKSMGVGLIKGANDENSVPAHYEAVKRKMSILDKQTGKSKNRSGTELVRTNSAVGKSGNFEFLEMINNFQYQIVPKKITISDKIQNDTKIIVCIRKRPLNTREKSRSEIDIICVPDAHSILVHECKLKVDLTKYLDNHKFQFDYVFDDWSSNELIYRFTAEPLIDCVFNGGRATCFAYGQTGSGKTYTISGDIGTNSRGILDYTICDVFERLRKAKYKNHTAFVSLFEIYAGKMFDLLNNRKLLRMLEDAHGQVQVCELVETHVTSPDHALSIIHHGSKLRSSGQTSANLNSSRSHSIFQLIIKKKLPGRGNKTAVLGKFSMIDLAGNERGVDTANCDRQTRLEGAEINKSLLALKECIRALCKKGPHLPFRASKLTQVLRDSFISENSKTCMIANISPGQTCCENTLNTLRYTDRVKEIESDKRFEVNTSSPDVNPNNELEMICSKNRNLYNFHKTVDDIYIQEEELYSEHKKLISEYSQWQNKDQQLLYSVENGNQDIDHYVAELETIIANRFSAFQSLKTKVDGFKSQLFEEEIASKRIKYLPTF